MWTCCAAFLLHTEYLPTQGYAAADAKRRGSLSTSYLFRSSVCFVGAICLDEIIRDTWVISGS